MKSRCFGRGVVVVMCYCLGAAASNTQAGFPKAGEWPCERRDGSRMAYSPLQGSIQALKVLWQCNVGTTVVFASLEPDGKTVQPVEMTSNGLPEAVPDARRWYPVAPEVLLEGKSQPRPENASERVLADLLPQIPGLEEVRYEMRTTGQYDKDFRLVCRAWKEGAWQTQWESEWRPGGNSVATGVLAGDYDHDGTPEIAVLPWYALYLFDGETGRLEERCAFTPGRCYGYFGAHDLNRDGPYEFVVMADFAKHVAVLGFREGRLEVLWKREIELAIDNPAKILRVRPDCVTDMDGDGVAEVIGSGFNERGDGRWRATAYDGLTGAVKAELENTYFEAAVDLDGDGRAEWLTTDTKEAGVSQWGPIRVWKWGAAGMECVWQSEGCAWEHHRTPVQEQVYNGATLGQETVLVRSTSRGFMAALRIPSGLRLVRWDYGFQTCASAEDASLQGLAIDDSGALLMQSRAGAKLEIQGRVAQLAAQHQAVALAPPAVAWPDGEKKALIAARGSGEEIVLLHPPVRGQTPEVARRVAGRAQDTSWNAMISPGPVMADLAGDGRRALLYATDAPQGCASFVAEDAITGAPLWHHDFPDIPGGAPIWNVGGIVLWQAGHFTDSTRMDVLVTVRRSMMHSEETALLSGRDGHECWRQKRQATAMQNRGVGGTPFALIDFDGDSLDDVVSFYPSLHYVLDGATGENLFKHDTSWPAVKDNPVYWGRPVVLPVPADWTAKPYVFMAGADLTALIDKAGQLVWADESGKGLGPFAFGDVDGDGVWEALGTGYSDGWRCCDTRTGAVEWRMPPVSGTLAGMASADLNGDGRCEILAMAGTVLYAIGIAAGQTTGQVLWQWNAPEILGPPVVADLEGRGEASILAVGQSGMMYALGG